MSESVVVVGETERARTLLQETRLDILERLAEPGSAVTLARAMELPRQRINYHLRELEAQRLIEVEREQQRGSVRERVYRRAGDSFAISPNALGALGSRPERVQDRFSSAYQIALASQAIADLASLRSGAAAAGQALATLSLEVDVRFADAERRSAFAQELSEAVAALARKYHDENASGGRTFKLYLGCYPKVTAPG
ncbi:MAG: helix-turn-helix domain-containing protein [Planctomycetes bacterium]|nr:helix-turn-helix domain-containing protein [Planctomycetota bacterium]